MLSHLIHGLDVLAWQNTGIMTRNPKGTQPKPIEPPKVASEVKATESLLEQKREKRDLRRDARAKLRATD